MKIKKRLFLILTLNIQDLVAVAAALGETAASAP